MVAGAFRRLVLSVILLLAVAILAGCSSPTKRHYLRHLSITVAPMPQDTAAMVESAVAVAEGERSDG